MTPLQKRCQELLPVIQAGAEGKVIEYMWGREPRALGEDRVAIQFLEGATYRIKPEPRYRPFTHQELAGQIGSKIRTKGRVGDCHVLWGLTGDERVLIRGGWFEIRGFQDLLSNWEFTDGTPCGVLLTD